MTTLPALRAWRAGQFGLATNNTLRIADTLRRRCIRYIILRKNNQHTMSRESRFNKLSGSPSLISFFPRLSKHELVTESQEILSDSCICVTVHGGIRVTYPTCQVSASRHCDAIPKHRVLKLQVPCRLAFDVFTPTTWCPHPIFDIKISSLNQVFVRTSLQT